MRNLYSLLCVAALTWLPTFAFAQSVGIGTTSPAASAALEVRSTSQGLLLPRLTLAQRNALTASTTAPPVPGLLIYLTDSTPGLYAYDGAAWVRLGADNLGNHTATQTLDLNAQRLLGTTSTSLGDSTAQVELNASVGTQSAALITRSNFGAKYTRTILSGYGKLPEGTTTPNDFGIWATAYRGGGWAGFFSTGSNLRAGFRWVGICQNPGYNNTGSAIRIVDGTQGAGKVLTSDGVGYGTWRALPAATAAGGNFDLGPYYLVGNGGSTGLAISSAGRVGINTTAPYSQLANTATNIIGSDGAGGNPGSLTWAADQAGYVSMFYNDNTATNANGLAVKVAATGTAAALDVSQGTTQDAAGTPLLRVQANGNVGIGTGAPAAQLTVQPASNDDVGLRVTNGVADGTAVSGNIVLQTLTGGNSGFSFLGFNGANSSGGEVRYGTSKNRWRLGVDQRSSDEFFLDTYGTSGTSVLRVSTAGNVGLGLAPSSTYKLDVSGQVRANGVVLTSDARFKQHVRPLGSALAAVLALRGVRYEWNALGVKHGGTAGAPQVGVLAQEVEKIYPELVSTDAEGYKAVNYAQFTPVLIEALKEQQAQIEALKQEAIAAKAEAAAAKTAAGAAASRAASAEEKAAQATATLETFEARLQRLEATTGGQARH
ncbi:tail fiber domain-containing protein [Hymenobacter negativus]|uniref:Tail fiber domain-containing protein n=1 Tax=Hymenobacter negativus TaxID=2795026 RepID=A0ABS3QHY6_9BACT|nr:tail fiber domain-containing protein [Hymenobacter negativus]MBO2010859.1 tail fiber domain-containing protein [Hymenobacter negativus]